MAEDKNLFVGLEHEVMDFWEREKCFERLREKNRGHKLFRFLDGPITANNPMGIHHAWGRSIKDIFIRYHAMRGEDCRCQNGFDSQGLWVEVEVEKELGFKTKKDIEAYGMDRFTAACKERVKHFSAIITEQSKRLGQWMDWDHSYFTNTDENIAGIWYFLKKCHEHGWIQPEYKPMPWCPRCGTSLSEHEMTGSYRLITHEAVYFNLPLKELGCDILVWTTTPWTLAANVALAVHPDLDYAEVKIKSGEKPLILAKSALKVLGGDKTEVVRIFKGSELVGLSYETCFPDFSAQREIEHKIVAWEEVAADEGTGVVHIAPGCGLEDFELGRKIGLAGIMPIDDAGVYLDGFGWMTGRDSHTVADDVFARLKDAGKLYKAEPHKHSYPVCWRCKSEVVFRLVPAWYIRTDEIRPKLIEAADAVKWEPASNGRRMDDWLRNMGDWNISRKRYYGMPLPFYPCECGHLTVVGSKEELRGLAVEPPLVDALPELHRPWIDEIKIRCPVCGREVSRISELGDVWLDAGIVPFSTFGYFRDREEWKRNFPAEWVTEMHEQVRLWFYSLLFMSVVLEGRAPYERVLTNSAVVAEDGSKFSKTGFMIQFDEAAEKIGADAVRYLYAGAPVAADVRFGYALGDEARRKLLSFWNIFTFFETYARLDKPRLENFTPEKSLMTPTDRWLVVRTNEFIEKATVLYDDYKVYLLIKDFEVFIDDVSNWYIRVNRRRFWKAGDEQDKLTAYWALCFALKTATQIMAPVIPFMTEYIWQNCIRKVLPASALSVHLSDWPSPVEGFEDNCVLEQTALARGVIAAALRLRSENQLKVRQPLSALYICCDVDKADKIRVFEKNISEELNVKEIRYLKDADELEEKFLTVNFKTAGAVLRRDANRLKQALAGLPDELMAELTAAVERGERVMAPGFEDGCDASLFTVRSGTRRGVVSAEFNGGVAGLNVELNDELIKEGLVRDVVRQCQLLRKEAGYEVEQRVRMSVSCANGLVTNALTEKRDYLQSELLAEELLLNESLKNADLTKEIEVGENLMTIEAARA